MYALLYVRVNCFIVRGCAVLRWYINVCNSDVFSVVNMYLDHLKFCVVCINGRRYVCSSECYAVRVFVFQNIFYNGIKNISYCNYMIYTRKLIC